jgi:hypothetical protein
LSNSCGETISSNCVSWNGPSLPGCIDVCQGASVTDIVYKEAKLLCDLITQFNSFTPPVTTPIVDFTSLDLGCLWAPTTTVWTCPSPYTFQADSSAPNGVGYCALCTPPTPCYIPFPIVNPISTVVPNPVPKPSTLLSVLQLLINRIPCCDPCATTSTMCCDAPYIWLSPTATGNPTLYPNGACSQNGTASAINPAVLPFKC